MKKVLYILIPLLLMGYLITITLIPRSKPQRFEVESKISNIQTQESKNKIVSEDHVNKSLNCKTCHACVYPTKEDPCLIECPRDVMPAVFHAPKEGPDVVVIDQMAENYGGVVFSHKMHSEMAEMSTGCTGCHHYNTTGPVLNCRNCHEGSRSREDVSVPDLKAAYHRQCMTCHQQWSGETGCNTLCHTRKGPDSDVQLKQKINDISGKSHPSLNEPEKMVWQTNYDKGKIVTFFHDEHIKLFKFTCTDCHSGDNCVKCHGPSAQKDFSKIFDIKKSEDRHHKPCASCHYINSCQKCHKETEMQPFNHARSTGWNLKSYHSNLDCSKCHGSSTPYKKLDNNCTSCHKNFVKGKFDHKITGLALTEPHNESECSDCHIEGNFAKAPVCSGCHDDKSFPKDSPGKSGRK